MVQTRRSKEVLNTENQDAKLPTDSSETITDSNDNQVTKNPRKKIKFEGVTPKKRSRPLKPKLVDSSSEEEQQTPVKKRGRPLGSKNKPKDPNAKTSKSNKRKKPEKKSKSKTTNPQQEFHPMGEFMENYRKTKSDNKKKNASISTKSDHFLHINMILVSLADEIGAKLHGGEFDLTSDFVDQLREMATVKTAEIEGDIADLEGVYEYYESEVVNGTSNVGAMFKGWVKKFEELIGDESNYRLFDDASIGTFWNKKGNSLRLVLTMLEKTTVQDSYMELLINRSRSTFYSIKYQHGGISVQQISQDMVIEEHRLFYLFKHSAKQPFQRTGRPENLLKGKDLSAYRVEAKKRRSQQNKRKSVKRKLKNERRFSQLELIVNSESSDVVKKLERLLFTSKDIDILRKHELLTHAALSSCPKEAFQHLVNDGLSWGKAGILGEFQNNCQRGGVTSTDESNTESFDDSECSFSGDSYIENQPPSPSQQNVEETENGRVANESSILEDLVEQPQNLDNVESSILENLVEQPQNLDNVEIEVDPNDGCLLAEDSMDSPDGSNDDAENRTHAERLV